MVEKTLLNASAGITLIMPKNGFSKDVLDALCDVCVKYRSLLKGYLVLKQEGDRAVLFFGFLFNHAEECEVLEQIVTEVSWLFSEDVKFECVCLNGKNKLIDAIRSMTSPFYQGGDT